MRYDVWEPTTFEEYVERHVPYFEKVRADGDLPWFEDPEKLQKLEPRVPGITEASAEDARRMLFDLRYSRPNAVADDLTTDLPRPADSGQPSRYYGHTTTATKEAA